MSTRKGSIVDQAKQRLREKVLSFERLRSLPGKKNLTPEEYEEMVSFIETLGDVAMSIYLRSPKTFYDNDDEDSNK